MSDVDKYQRQAVEDGNNLRILKAQRDQLREALSSIVECWDGPLYRHEMLPRIQQARAALKATEEDV